MKTQKTFRHCLKVLVAACLMVVTGCNCITLAPLPTTVQEVRPGILQGYLPPDQIPNSLTLLPAPPDKESAAFAADQEAFRKTRSLAHTPRWAQAARDANLHFPEAPEAFSCALGVPITGEVMPNLYMLMRRTWTDAILATFAAKNSYKRIRPFVVNKETSCTPNDEKELAKDGSYPSGHTAIGWTWTLILTEIAPERADALLSRGYAYGQSRVICGVHWQSDVTAGRVVASAVVARLHAAPVFRAQLEAAKKELTAARTQGIQAVTGCRAEAEALKY